MKSMLRQKWLILVFISVIAIQLYLLVTFIISAGHQVWLMRDMSPIQKSAMMTWTKEFSDYIGFLNNVIPEDAKVIIPPNNSGLPLDNVGYIQYLLFPRDIHNCGQNEIEACILRVTGSNTYILANSNFPPKELAEQSKTYIKFSDGYGVYVPKQ
jgi:hypothetical protein